MLWCSPKQAAHAIVQERLKIVEGWEVDVIEGREIGVAEEMDDESCQVRERDADGREFSVEIPTDGAEIPSSKGGAVCHEDTEKGFFDVTDG